MTTATLLKKIISETAQQPVAVLAEYDPDVLVLGAGGYVKEIWTDGVLVEAEEFRVMTADELLENATWVDVCASGSSDASEAVTETAKHLLEDVRDDGIEVNRYELIAALMRLRAEFESE